MRVLVCLETVRLGKQTLKTVGSLEVRVSNQYCTCCLRCEVMGRWSDQSKMNKKELQQDIVSTVFNARVHQQHGAEIRQDASTFEDMMRDTLTATVPSQVAIIATTEILVFERPGWMKIQAEYLEIEEQVERIDATNLLCTSPRKCAR